MGRHLEQFLEHCLEIFALFYLFITIGYCAWKGLENCSSISFAVHVSIKEHRSTSTNVVFTSHKKMTKEE